MKKGNIQRANGQLDSCANHQSENLIDNLISGVIELKQSL